MWEEIDRIRLSTFDRSELDLKILFMSELFYPHGGGAEVATYLYAKLLSDSGCNVVVVTNQFSGESAYNGTRNFPIYRVPLFEKEGSIKYSVLYRFDALLTGLIRKWVNWADIVYIPRFWFSVIPMAKVCGKRVIVHLHDYIPVCPLANLYDSRKNSVCNGQKICSPGCIFMYERKRKDLLKATQSTFFNLVLWPLFRRSIELSDAIICVSRAQRDALLKRWPSLSAKSSMIYNPVPDVPMVDIKGDGFGYFGGLSYSKGFAVLREALGVLRVNPIVVHAANFANPRVMTRMLSSLGVVIYGRLGPRKISELYELIRGVLVPSVVPETFSYVVAEALLRGRIIVASRIGAIPELVDGCDGVFMFNPGDGQQLAERMAYVRDLDGETTRKLGLHNRETFKGKFNNEKVVADFLDLSEDLISMS